MKTRNMALCALFAALLALCAWISFPVADVAFTLQSLGVALALGLLGGKRGSASVFAYLLLGAVGLPVFSGFQGGLGILLGATGGYIWGFLVWGLVYWLLTAILPDTGSFRLLAMVLGLLSCYAVGSVWFWQLYLQNGSSLSVGLVLLKCVVPYILPDTLKLMLASYLTKRVKPYL